VGTKAKAKDKNGVITRDVLTKKWTEWVDYWAVDFDYESRKEIVKVAIAAANAPTRPANAEIFSQPVK
jgi:hypothetical protein